ncbi:MAG: hypothetical protein HKO07_00400 [Pseudomonadales bacterium]|nr:hypothetical protein [Pseudomonadales bacterium]
MSNKQSIDAGQLADAQMDCVVYRVERREGAYLYVLASDDTQIAPETPAAEKTEADKKAAENSVAKNSGTEDESDDPEKQATVLDTLPASLLATLGPVTEVMGLQLQRSRKLAAADVVEVMQQLRAQGYYLQMPPAQPKR